MRSTDALAARTDDVNNALSAGNNRAAVDLLLQEWHTWATVNGASFKALVESIPSEEWATDPRMLTALGASYRSLNSKSRSAALPYFRTATALIDASEHAPVDTVASLRIYHAAALRSLGQFAEADRLASAAWDALDHDVTLAPSTRVALQARASLQQGILAIHRGDYDVAMDRLRLALGLSEGVLTAPEIVECLSGLSFLAYARGEFPSAEEYAARAKVDGTVDIIESQFGVLTLIVELLLAVERNHLAEALALAPKVNHAAENTDWEPLSLYAMAAITILTRHHVEGLGHVRDALQLTRTWTGVVTARVMCEGMRATLYIHLGESEKAIELLSTMTPTQNHANCPARFVAGIHFKAGDSAACLAALDECEKLGDQHSNRTVIDVLLLKAAANYDRENNVVADVAFDCAMLIVSSTLIRSPFTLIPPSTMTWMLSRAGDRLQPETMQAIFDQFAAGLHGAPRQPLEPLSLREKDVAQYLHLDKTLGEIAEELFVSTNTVKTHVKNIYRKLEASNRKEAVRRARELGLTTKITRN